jgi:hypothetical protein
MTKKNIINAPLCALHRIGATRTARRAVLGLPQAGNQAAGWT